jgi:hypothetical protein
MNYVCYWQWKVCVTSKSDCVLFISVSLIQRDVIEGNFHSCCCIPLQFARGFYFELHSWGQNRSLRSWKHVLCKLNLVFQLKIPKYLKKISSSFQFEVLFKSISLNSFGNSGEISFLCSLFLLPVLQCFSTKRRNVCFVTLFRISHYSFGSEKEKCEGELYKKGGVRIHAPHRILLMWLHLEGWDGWDLKLAYMKQQMHKHFRYGNFNRTDYLGDLGVDGRIWHGVNKVWVSILNASASELYSVVLLSICSRRAMFQGIACLEHIMKYFRLNLWSWLGSTSVKTFKCADSVRKTKIYIKILSTNQLVS